MNVAQRRLVAGIPIRQPPPLPQLNIMPPTGPPLGGMPEASWDRGAIELNDH